MKKRSKAMDFCFKVGFSMNKFMTDYPYEDKINIKFKYYNDKITICQIEDSEANQIYTQFASMNIFSKKIFKPEIYKDSIIFTGKSICLPEDIYKQRIGENISLEKAIEKRRAFYVMLMDLVNMRLLDIRHETGYTIRQKWENIWDKKVPEDKQLELPFQKISIEDTIKKENKMKCLTCYHYLKSFDFIEPHCINPKNETGELSETCPYYLSDEYLDDNLN